MRLVIFKMSTTLGLFFLSILILSVKSNVNSDCSESRIIFEGQKNGENGLNCIKVEFSILKCTCSESVDLKMGRN